MKKTIAFVACICLFLTNSFGQAEGNNWYFGNYAGLSFSTSPPTILNDGHLTTGEGCAAVSSKAGALVFYTDGNNVWDASHTLMPNGTGLFGNPSSTQSAVICPKPGTYNYSKKHFDGYYIITIDFVGGPNGVSFSEIDMTLNGNLGDVVVANKNTLLFGTTTVEGANVARHANGCDYWIIGKEVGNNTFNVYPITSAGVNLTPVVSSVGGITPAGWGNVKVSANNKLIGLANMTIGTQVFDFDNSTGILSFKFSDAVGGYSLDFSADNNVLYSAILNNPNIYQFDLTSPNNAAFQASKTIIGTTANTIGYRMCALQMAPDGKIYAALQGTDYVGVINNPNTLGGGCNYVDNGPSIAGINSFSGTAMSNSLGLPAFPSFFITQPTKVISKKLCYLDQTLFKLSDTTLVNLVEWTITDMGLLPITQSTDFEPTFQFMDTGQFIVSTIVHYPCFIDSFIRDTIRISDLANVDLGIDTLLCTGDNIVLDAGTGYEYYFWNNGDTTQTTSVNTTGQYSVQVLIQSEDSLCERNDTINVVEFPIPIAAFTATNECFGTPTSFTDVSNNSGGTITNWEWDFDNDGTVDTTAQNPVFTFSIAGTFPVNLSVSTANGACSHDTTIDVVVNPLPVADFTFTSVCANDTAFFSDASTISTGSITAFAWDFGNGPPAGTSALQNPAYVYDSSGTFIAILTVTSDSGCTDVQGTAVEIFPIPVAAFDAPGVCVYNDAVFTNTSTISSGTITSWQWDFGDTDTSSMQNPTHRYTTDSTYNVTMITTSFKGCSDTIIQPVDIYPKPVAAYNSVDVCLYDPAVFTDISSISSGTIASWYWQFDDGNTSTLQNPSHTYSADGTYDVSLMTLSNFNCIDTAIVTLTIHPVPLADFATNNECLYDAAVFTDATTINTPGTIASWNWDFGDGSVNATSQNTSHNYTIDGIFNVVLTTTSDMGCIDDSTYPVEIYPVPVTAFTSDTLSGCEPLCVTFTDATAITNGTINSWDWDFGDGNVGTDQISQNCYTAIDENTSRISTVRLIATSLDGCSDTLTMVNMIEAWPKPLGDFTTGPQPTTLLAPAIDFADQSLGNVVSWSWDFGDGDTILNGDSTKANLTHVYTDTGIYIIEQIVKTSNLCSDTTYRTIIIDPDFIIHVPNAFTPNGDDFNDVFIPKGVGIDPATFEMHIYDRWGAMVFETKDITIPWDGKVNEGKKGAQESVYVWRIFTSDLVGKKHEFIGHVTLLR